MRSCPRTSGGFRLAAERGLGQVAGNACTAALASALVGAAHMVAAEAEFQGTAPDAPSAPAAWDAAADRVRQVVAVVLADAVRG